MLRRICVVAALIGTMFVSQGAVAAGEFTVVNRGNRDVYIAYCHFVSAPPSDPNLSNLAVFEPDAWVTEGHWLVPAGQSKVIYNGPSSYLRIRMHIVGEFNNIIRPENHRGEESHWMHPTLRYRVTQTVGSSRAEFRHGPNYEHQTYGQPPAGFRRVGGFFIMNSHTMFTVR